MRLLNAFGGDGHGLNTALLRGLVQLANRNKKMAADTHPGGRKRQDPAAPPKEVCAMLIAVAWQETRGETAPGTGPSNLACIALWELAGKDPPSGQNVKSSWYKYLQKANDEVARAAGPISEARELAADVSMEKGIEAAAVATQSAPLWASALQVFGLRPGLPGDCRAWF